MPDITKENAKYFKSVIQSVIDLHGTETEIESDRKTLDQFTDFLTKNADEISKFNAVENEIVDYLKQFSFAGKMDFSPVKSKLQPLPALKEKLVEMGAEAKKLAGKPDRYNCHKAIEVCKKLTLFCRNEMQSKDYGNVANLLDTNIPKLLVIQQEFEKEKQILADIKKILQSNKKVLDKFSAFNAELQQFVANFPNNRDTDLKTVEQQITTLNSINQQAEDTEKTLATVKPYADRFNKNSIAGQAANILSSLYSQMKFGDTGSAKSNLQQNISAIKTLITHFDKEEKDTKAFLADLKKHSCDIWKDDNEQMVNELDNIVKQKTRNSNYSLQSYFTRVQSATGKKTQSIGGILKKYKWLRRKCYAFQVDNLRNNRNLSFADFQSQIESIRKGRGLFTKLTEAIFYS